MELIFFGVSLVLYLVATLGFVGHLLLGREWPRRVAMAALASAFGAETVGLVVRAVALGARHRPRLQMTAQPAEHVERPFVFRPEGALEIFSYAPRQSGRAAAGRHRDGEIAAAQDRGRDEGAELRAVDDVEQHAGGLGLARDGGVHRFVVGCRIGQHRSRQIARSIGARHVLDLAARGPRRQVRRQRRADHRDARTRRQQRLHLACRDRPAADDHAAPSRRAQENGVILHRRNATTAISEPECACAAVPQVWPRGPTAPGSHEPAAQAWRRICQGSCRMVLKILIPRFYPPSERRGL